MARSLDKYGVPLPSGRNKTMLQPKPKYRFRVIVYDFGTDIDEKDYIALDTDSVDRPSVSFDTHQIPYFNSNTSYLGKHDWKAITLTLRDGIDNKSTKALYRQLQKQLDFQRRISDKTKQQYSGYKFSMIIECLNGRNSDDTLTNLGRNVASDALDAITNNEGLVNSVDRFIGGGNSKGTIEYWKLTGCIITDINYDTYDYGSSQPMMTKVTIKPDTAVQYDNISEMYNEMIDSLLSDKTNNALDIIDKIFGQARI